MDIIILDRNIKGAINFMSEISKRFMDYRIIYITDNYVDFNNYIENNVFDVVIIDECFVEKCEALFKYRVHKICLGDEMKKYTGFTSILRNSETIFYDKLTKIISENLNSSEKVRKAVRHELEYLGYNFSLRGTKYLEDAIVLMYMKNTGFNLEREVFNKLSKLYKKTSHSIKVNIQNSTNMVITACGYKKISEYLGIESYYGIGTKGIVCSIINKIDKKLK